MMQSESNSKIDIPWFRPVRMPTSGHGDDCFKHGFGRWIGQILNSQAEKLVRWIPKF